MEKAALLNAGSADIAPGQQLEPARCWGRWAALVIAGLFVFRLIYTALVPLDLVHDEAYYWDWSRQLDWGYYSKPPMIAWLIGLSTSLAGSTTMVVRLPAIVLGTGGLVLVYLLGSRMYSPKVGFWAMLLSAATPGNAALGLLMTIDAPLLFCWSSALYCLWRVLERGPDRTRWLILATLVTGCGILSKQTMLGLIPLAGVFLLCSTRDRRELRSAGFWCWALGSIAFLAPVVWWNVQHDWITLQHTSEHFNSSSASIGRHVVRSLEFLGSQFGVVSPLTGVLFVTVMVLAARAFRRLERRELFLCCFSGLPLVGVIVLSLLQRVEPNWPAAFYPAGIVLVAAWAAGACPVLRPPRNGDRRLRWAVAAGSICVLVTYSLPFGLGLEGTKLDPAARLRGWHELGQAVGRHLDTMPAPAQTLVIVAAGRAPASELAFYMPQQPRVYLWSNHGQIRSQYDLWGGPRDNRGWEALIVTKADETVPSRLQAAFATVESAGTVTVPVGNGRELSYRLWRGFDYQNWPDPTYIARPLDSASQLR